MNAVSGLWEFLTQDVTFLGGPHSPMLSWLGSCGIVLFFVWQVYKLTKEIDVVRRAFDRVRPMLIALAKERGDVDPERFNPHPKKGFDTPAGRPGASPPRIDCDDLRLLDSKMQHDPMFRGPWTQYRLTLILEKVPWFMEPRIFSTKQAAEVFTQEALLTNHVNLAFYRQFPSLITGIGLLLTFLALFVGLGKLHAEGGEIVGIQGLINGLAGKFLTSIVGLIVANMFTFIEKPLVSQLTNMHYTFLGLIDQLFPRKTMEQMLEQLTSISGDPQRNLAASDGESREPLGGWGNHGLAASGAHLTAMIQSLTTVQQNEHAETRRTVTELPRVISNEVHASLNELVHAIHDLTRLLKETKTSPEPVKMPLYDHPFVKKASPRRRGSSSGHFFEKISSWPWWSRNAIQRRTG